MIFTIHGPFKLWKNDNGLVDHSREARKYLENEMENDETNLAEACGCYLFGVRAGKGIRPCYVGMAEGQAFISECFSQHKINIYNNAIANRNVSPVLFLVAKRTKGDKFVKPHKNQKSLRLLENLLIGTCLEKNEKLANVMKTKLLRTMKVPGYLNTPQGNPGKGAKIFRKAIGKK